MEEFEKVEELVRVTGVSFEEATNAIRACDGNIVDAMVYLEKLGKINKDAAKKSAPSVEEKCKKADEKCKKAFEDVKKPAGKFVDFMTKNKLNIKKGDDTFATVPVGAAALLGLAAPIAVPAAFVSMMCGYEYSFTGDKAGVDKANEVMGKAEAAAEKAKEAVDKAKEEFAKASENAEDNTEE
jgi:hypothetical protein